MGLGKSIQVGVLNQLLTTEYKFQVIAFTEIFFRVTRSKRALIICPINVIQNWQQEFDKWLPRQEGIRDFPVFLLGDLVKSQAARLDLVCKLLLGFI
jgi:hypothetical protein